MNIQDIKRKCVYFAALPLLLLPPLQSLAGDSAPDGQSDSASGLPIEEIQVLQKRSLGQLRRDMTRAENDLFEMYNSLVDDREFEIVCWRMQATRNHTKTRVCQPRFMQTAIRKQRLNDAQRPQRISNPTFAAPIVHGALISAPSNIALQKQELNNFLLLEEKFTALVGRHKELADAIDHLNAMKLFYTERHAERFDE
jgi:hypothetical protein